MSVYYRADRRHIEAGKEMPPGGDHRDRSNDNVKRAEDVLRPYHSKGARRKNCVFVFEDQKEARNYYETKPGLYLYKLCVAEEDIIHRGDLTHIDDIGRAIKAGREYESLMKAWVDGMPSSDPRYETLAEKATVVEILGTPENSPAAKSHMRRAIERQEKTPIEGLLKDSDLS